MQSDVQLQRDVLDELKWEPSLTAAHIGVTANAGVITLSGHVESFLERRSAEKTASRVKGVKAVAEEIEVHLPFDKRRGDDDIASAALERLSWDVSVPRDSVKVKVEKGWVTLTGEVDWYYQKQAANHDIHVLLGVIGVSDQITIKARSQAVNGIDDIMHALERSWFFNPQAIQVSSIGGNVRLTGTVNSWHDKQVATSTAWASPGTVSVQNELMVA